jgi:hypothetical protein
LQLDIEVSDLPALVARLRGLRDGSGITLANALGLRFGGLDPVRMYGGDLPGALAISGRDVDLETLRQVLRGTLPHGLERLLGACSPGTRASGLLLAAELPVWSENLEKLVKSATIHADSRVRRAAYASLRTRDPELWECAWLALEARFDPDESVRSAAR